MEYYVSRQSYWGVDKDDRYCVEIAEGGLDYANCDMLVAKYEEEGEYDNPVDAANAAIEVKKQWKRDNPELNIRIDYGSTHGFTMPFLSDNSDEEILEWANKVIENMPKCLYCGKPFELYNAWSHEFSNDNEFCSEYCADKNYYELMLDEEEVE